MPRFSLATLVLLSCHPCPLLPFTVTERKNISAVMPKFVAKPASWKKDHKSNSKVASTPPNLGYLNINQPLDHSNNQHQYIEHFQHSKWSEYFHNLIGTGSYTTSTTNTTNTTTSTTNNEYHNEYHQQRVPPTCTLNADVHIPKHVVQFGHDFPRKRNDVGQNVFQINVQRQIPNVQQTRFVHHQPSGRSFVPMALQPRFQSRVREFGQAGQSIVDNGSVG